MLRNLQGFSNKNIDATLKSAVATVRGRVVQKDYTNGNVILPTSQEGLFFINKAQIPTGLMSLEGELSDYDTRYETIAIGDAVVLEKPLSGEVYGTTEFVAASFVVGSYAAVSDVVDATQGKFIYSATATGFRYKGTIVDNGITLAVIEVL